MNQNYLGTDWILEVKEKEILKLLQAYTNEWHGELRIISQMDKFGKKSNEGCGGKMTNQFWTYSHTELM